MLERLYWGMTWVTAQHPVPILPSVARRKIEEHKASSCRGVVAHALDRKGTRLGPHALPFGQLGDAVQRRGGVDVVKKQRQVAELVEDGAPAIECWTQRRASFALRTHTKECKGCHCLIT